MTRSRWIWLGAVALMVAAWLWFGWQGALVTFSAGVFLMLLQFSRALRVLQAAGRAPVGHVGSAVMLHSRLRQGMRLPDVLRLTGSLGVAVGPPAGDGNRIIDVFRWTDAGGVAVEVELVDGRCRHWTMRRPDDGDGPFPASSESPESAADRSPRTIA